MDWFIIGRRKQNLTDDIYGLGGILQCRSGWLAFKMLDFGCTLSTLSQVKNDHLTCYLYGNSDLYNCNVVAATASILSNQGCLRLSIEVVPSETILEVSYCSFSTTVYYTLVRMERILVVASS